MKNSILIANELHGMLPVNQRPEYTENYEGFFHLNQIAGTVESTVCKYLIRDYEQQKLELKKSLMESCAGCLNAKYGSGTITLEIADSYYNMRGKIELAEKAYLKAGVEPRIVPCHGGTDGAGLSYMGLPTPNIFTGGLNGHGKFEYIPIEAMEKAVQVIINIVELNCEIRN